MQNFLLCMQIEKIRQVLKSNESFADTLESSQSYHIFFLGLLTAGTSQSYDSLYFMAFLTFPESSGALVRETS